MFCFLPLLSNFTQSRQSLSDCGGVTAGRTLEQTEGLVGNQPSTHTVRVSINPKRDGGFSSLGSLSLLISILLLFRMEWASGEPGRGRQGQPVPWELRLGLLLSGEGAW